MEAVSVEKGQRKTDRPAGVPSWLTSCCIGVNDAADDRDRQILQALLEPLAGLDSSWVCSSRERAAVEQAQLSYLRERGRSAVAHFVNTVLEVTKGDLMRREQAARWAASQQVAKEALTRAQQEQAAAKAREEAAQIERMGRSEVSAGTRQAAMRLFGALLRAQQGPPKEVKQLPEHLDLEAEIVHEPLRIRVGVCS